MYCAKCGGLIDEGALFCPKCGQATPRVSESLPVVTPLSPPPSVSAASGYAPPPVALTPAVMTPHVTRPYAGFWLRVVAHLIDAAILGAIFFALFIPVAMFTGLGAAMSSFHPGVVDPEEVRQLMGGGFILGIMAAGMVGLAGGWLYYAMMESSAWEATVGKKALSLTVTNLDGARISFAHASGRYFAKIVSGLVPFGIGYILAGLTAKKQALHDMIAGSLVLRRG